MKYMPENYQQPADTFDFTAPPVSLPPVGQVNELNVSGNEESDDETYIFENFQVSELPPRVLHELSQNTNVQKLSFKGNLLTNLPPFISMLSQLYYVNLSQNKLREVPECLFKLGNLEILDLSHNQLSVLPEEITTLPHLKALSLIANNFDYFPKQLLSMENLIILEFNRNPMRSNPQLKQQPDEDEELWLKRVKQTFKLEERNLRTERGDNTESGRNRSFSESSTGSSKASKRKGFVFQRYPPDSGNIHTRANSTASQDGQFDSQQFSIDSLAQITHHQHSPQHLNTTTPKHTPTSSLSYQVHTEDKQSLQDLNFSDIPPRSPIQRSPYDSPRDSPRPSITDLDAQTTNTTRLSTLEEEDHDNTEADSDINTRSVDLPSRSSSKAKNMPKFNQSVFRRESSTKSSVNTSHIRSLSGSNPLSSKDTADLLKEPLRDICTTFSQFTQVFTPDVQHLLAETQKFLQIDDYMRSLYSTLVLISKVLVPQVFSGICAQIGKRGQRKLASLVVTAFPELEAAWQHIQQAKITPIPYLQANSWPVDEQLHEQLKFATRKTAKVLSLMNSMISKLANSVAVGQSDPAAGLSTKVRELSHVCIRCGTSVRRMQEQLKSRVHPSQILMKPGDSRRFYDHVNLFMKSVISILSAIKTAISEIPQIADLNIGTEVANLTRIVKEIPPLLEHSSYHILLDPEEPQDTIESQEQPILTINTAVAQQPQNFPLPTPLTASLGAAAQMLMSPSERTEERDGYI